MKIIKVMSEDGKVLIFLNVIEAERREWKVVNKLSDAVHQTIGLAKTQTYVE